VLALCIREHVWHTAARLKHEKNQLAASDSIPDHRPMGKRARDPTMKSLAGGIRQKLAAQSAAAEIGQTQSLMVVYLLQSFFGGHMSGTRVQALASRQLNDMKLYKDCYMTSINSE